MANTHNPMKDQKLPTLPHRKMDIVFLNLLTTTGCDGISRGPEKKNRGLLSTSKEVTVSFVVQSLHNGKVQGLSQVLARVVCEAGSSQLAFLKLF